jgi:DDE superfamily endonuclease
MLKSISNAFEVVSATLSKVKEVSGPVRKFILHIIPLWLSMNCRYVFMNLGRWGGRSEKSYRNMFAKTFEWFSFNLQVVKACFGKKKLIAVFDPTFLKKSGKKTHAVGRFYSGTAGKALKGLEVGCLCFVGVEDHSALHLLCKQSPTPESLHQKGGTLVGHYAEVVVEHAAEIKKLTSYVVVDGYFMKKDFIVPLVAQGLHLITKARSDANLQYVYKGKQKSRGRKRVRDGKIDVAKLDKRRIGLIRRDKEKDVYAGVVYSVLLNRKVLAAFIYYKEEKTGAYKTNPKGKAKPEIIIATDIEMKAKTMCHYYGLRFQVEFLIRDAKSYCGLEHCQARSEEKLHNHFNLALTAVSVAKAAYYLSLPKKQREGFSMAGIKMRYMNKLLTNRIFHNLDLDPSCEKYKWVYEDSLNFGRLRA